MDKTTQALQAKQFHGLHNAGDPLVLVNVWDAGSALAVQAAGSQAIATSSHALAQAAGYADGEQIPVEQLARIVARIVDVCSVPVTVDLEAGYGRTAADVAQSVALILEAGAIGINLEDGLPDGSRQLRAIDAQQERIGAARRAAEQARISLYINARIDTYLINDQAPDNLARTVERARAVLHAGASGIFVPGLVDRGTIAELCKEIGAPVNIMLSHHAPNVAALAAAGVSRISLGGMPFEYYKASFRTALMRFLETGRPASFVQRAG